MMNNKDFSVRVVKGINQKMNYLYDNYTIIDLEENIPHIWIP